MNRSIAVLVLLGLWYAARSHSAEPEKFNAINVSWGDHIVIFEGEGRLDTDEKIGRAIKRWREEFGIRHVYWRISFKIIHTYMIRAEGTATKYYDALSEIEARLDAAAAAVRHAHAHGLKVFMYLTIFDMGSPPTVRYGGKAPFPWQSRFTASHPEYQVVDRAGTQYQYGVCEYAYPEVRQYKIRQIAQLFKEYDFDGVYICTRTHSEPVRHADQFGYNKPIVDEFKKRHGVDILTEEFDKEAWRRLRGEYLVQFYRELRKRFPNKLIATAIPRGDRVGPPYGNMHLDWQTIVKERLVDELIVGVISGKWLYPNHQDKTDAEKGYLCSQEEKLNIPPLDEAVAGEYGPACRAAGVRLFIQGAAHDRKQKQRLNSDPHLTGFMSHSTSLMTGRTYLEIPDHPSLAFSDGVLTADFWIRLHSAKPKRAGRVISKYDHTLPRGSGRGWEIYIDDKRRIVFRLGSEAGERALTSQTPLPLDQWTHVACVSEGEGGKMKIYINGSQDPAERKAPPSIRVVPVDVFVGRYAGGHTQFLHADLDEVRLSRIARAFQEVASTPAASDKATVLLYHCNRLSERRIRNATGEPGLDATAHGVTPSDLVPGMPGFGRALKLEPAH